MIYIAFSLFTKVKIENREEKMNWFLLSARDFIDKLPKFRCLFMTHPVYDVI